MPNALAQEKSPYLLQHAGNPVDWLSWGEAAFAKARGEQKPIFLSIGYSTCHWCHVMAHESFESEAVAKILNEHFVSIKVDREERPDVDRVYMTYVQAMTGHGGWPLSAWLTPQLKPFYGGTYYPPEDRQGRMGFGSLLQAIARGWRDDREKLVAEGERAIAALREHFGGGGAETAPGAEAAEGFVEAASKAFENGYLHFYESFDATHGGFGSAPKFPRASNLAFLFRVAALQGPQSELATESIRMASATLRAMARGGVHDHVGGGYHRYSVDEAWFVPHFEKMLYDEAQIAVNCLEAKQATGDERFAWMARDILDYVLRELRSPEGGFHTAEDADSLIEAGRPEHAEGAFYVWTAGELRGALGTDFDLFAAHFGVQETGNVPGQLDPQGELRGKNILVQRRPLAESAKQAALTLEAANDRLLAALQKLRVVRAQRPRPHLDDKVLTANNGLMISALAKAHQILEVSEGRDGPPGRPLETARPAVAPYLNAAVTAAAFIERELYDAQRGVLFRTWRGSRGTTEGFAEDYAFFIQALLDLYEASFDVHWLQWAERLQGKMDELFWDGGPEPQTQGGRGGYFNSAAHDASIVLRLKEDYDGAEPAPSSVAAMNLLRLAALLGDAGKSYAERGRRCIDAFRAQWTKVPHAMPQMLCALELALEPPRHVVLAGDPTGADFRALTEVLHERLGPRRIILAVDAPNAREWLAARAPWLAGMKALDGQATAYVCEEFSCQAPVTTPDELRPLIAPR